VDILEKRVLWNRLTDNDSGEYPLPSHVGAVLPAEDGTWRAFLTDGVYSVKEDGTDLALLAQFPHQLPPDGGTDRMRANDATATPWGEALCGTMPYEPDRFPGTAALYRFDGHSLTSVLTGVTISNGLGWTNDLSTMFYVDTPTSRIDRFDVSRRGKLSHRRPFATIDPQLGFPDGLAVDEDGYVWVALWGGSRVQRIAPDGTMAGFVSVPTAQVTSCAFAGEDLKTLIVTTAGMGDDSPSAGVTYYFDAPSAGAASFRVAS
jgi:sugar lactone lactonase YvrE